MKVLKKHGKGIIVSLVIIIAAGILLSVYFRRSKESTEAQVIKQNAISLGKQTLTKSISATGTIESKKTKAVSANLNGVVVKKVKVSVGDTVKKGQDLVTFDKSELKEALAEAKENLSEAKSEASDSIASAKEQVASAKEAYRSAVSQAAKAKSEQQKAKEQQEKAKKEAKAAVTKAKKEVASIEKKIKKTKDPQELAKLQDQLSQAQQALSQAQTAYQNVNSSGSQTTSSSANSGSDSTSQAKSSVTSAENNLKNTRKSAERSIKEAKKQVDQARENLEKCAVTAPITGVVTSVSIESGSTYSGGTMFQIDDTSSFKVSTTVDEYDISDVSLGQKAVILTEATDEEEINGEITFVAPSTSSTSSVSSASSGSGASGGSMSGSSSDGYEVIIDLKDANEKLRMGMTAKCSIILEEAEDVFAVPYDAIHKDSEHNDVIYVAKDEGDTSNYTEVPVTKGMESDYYVEISGDELEEGMLVVIPTDETEEKSESQSSSDTNMMFPGGMGGGSMNGGHRDGSRGNRGSSGSGGNGGNGGGPGGPPGN